MGKKLIEDVEMPTDSRVSREQAIQALKRRGCEDTEINYLKSIISDKEIFDFSGYSGITTFLAISLKAGKSNLCIKISDVPHQLERSYVMLNLMSKYNLFPRVIKYISTNKDYLITEAVEAPMAVNAFGDFRSLSNFMGKALRCFHDIHWDESSMTELEKNIITSKTESFLSEALSHEKGLYFLAQYQNDFDYEGMKEYLKNYQADYIANEVMIHGDFNPRNVFVCDGQLAAVVDLADTCFGDRHYDIYFSMWTVALYSGILDNSELVAECEKIFLDSYGRDKINQQRMEYCKKLTCMYWQEHNDIRGLI